MAPRAKPIAEMTSAELENLAKIARAREQAKLAKEGARIRKEVEAYVKEKYNLTLAQVFTASDKEPKIKVYRHPETKEEYTYSGRGMLPKKIKGEGWKLVNEEEETEQEAA